MYPAIPDNTAPIRKPIETCNPSRKYEITNITKPTIAIVEYCLDKYALAPSWIAPAISCIFSFPVSAESTEIDVTIP